MKSINDANILNNAPIKINTYFIGAKTLLNPQINPRNENFDQNKKESFFPHDFFKLNLNKEKEKKEKNKINSRSIFVNLQKEYDEDRELLELLLSTNKPKNQSINNMKIKREEDKNNKQLINNNISIDTKKINPNIKQNKIINNENKKLFFKKHNQISLMQKYRNNNNNNSNRNILDINKILNKKELRNSNNNVIKNISIKKEKNFNDIKSLKYSLINDKYQYNDGHNIKITRLIKKKQNDIFKKIMERKINKSKIDKNNISNFFSHNASESVYLPSRKKTVKNNYDIKEYRLGLLSAGSTSYNNVIIPMISLSRQPSGFFNKHNNIESENEKSFGEYTLKNRENYRTYRKNNLFFNKSGQNGQNQKVRKLSSFQKRNNLEEFKDVEKLISKFHKIKIEKGMMDSKLTKTLKDNFISTYNIL